MSTPKKYEHIDFKPPEGVAKAAERGLELRKKAPKSSKGGLTVSQASKEGIGSGVQRAVNLKNRDTISPKVAKQMKSFFARHEKNKGIGKDKTAETDKGYQAWLLWGGDPGKAWANKLVRQMDAADNKAKLESFVQSFERDSNIKTIQTIMEGINTIF
jgi:hypothetical protein